MASVWMPFDAFVFSLRWPSSVGAAAGVDGGGNGAACLRYATLVPPW